MSERSERSLTLVSVSVSVINWLVSVTCMYVSAVLYCIDYLGVMGLVPAIENK